MGGNTGNIRTQRNQSGTVGSRRLGSILSHGGPASFGRIYQWGRKNGVNIPLQYPRIEWALKMRA
jgi:hypothetical protein